jgi:hypothetical protein
VTRLCELYRGICLTTEEKARENLSQGSRRVPVGTMKTDYKNRTHITIRIHKHNNKNTSITKLNKSIPNIQPLYNDKSSKLHMIYISSNNVRHPVTKTFTTLHPTTLNNTWKYRCVFVRTITLTKPDRFRTRGLTR